MSDKSNDAKGDTPKVTYVKGYDDPEADMVLKAKDGKLFRVHSYQLKTHSAYFRYMALPSELGTHSQSKSAIEIDSDSGKLTYLLNQVTFVNPPRIPHWAAAEAILKLGARYQFETLPRLVSVNLDPHIRGDPIEVFVIASQIDQEALAKAAISSLARHRPWDKKRIQDLEESGFVHATGSYVVALVRAMRLSEKDYSHIDWSKAASLFRVKR